MSRDEFNGLGARLNKAEGDIREVLTKTERNSSDIQKIFDVAEHIQQTVDSSKWQVFAIVSIPVILLVIQYISGK